MVEYKWRQEPQYSNQSLPIGASAPNGSLPAAIPAENEALSMAAS